MNIAHALAVTLALNCVGGCTALDRTGPAGAIIPNQALNISDALQLSAESIVAAGLLFKIVDPLAPNWRIEQTRIGENRFRIAMRKKRFTTGGDGEALPAFYRHAEQILQTLGGESYRIIEFTEGIDSAVPIAQRIAQGIVEVIRKSPDNP